MYPISYEADYARERNRLTTFFRIIVAIPWLIVGYIYSFVAQITAFFAWVAILILGHYPPGLYDLNAGLVRALTRFSAFTSLQTDAWPPFGISSDPTYPVRLQVAQPAERQSRLSVFFRLILAIPLLVVSYAILAIQFGVSILSWLTIVFRGYQPAGVHNAIAFTHAWTARFYGYLMLLRDEYPPVGDEGPQVGDLPAPGQPAFAGPAAASSQPTTPSEG